MKIPVTILDADGNSVRVLSTPGHNGTFETFDKNLYDPTKDKYKMIIKAGWIEEIADD
jgi:hypothetical protein